MGLTITGAQLRAIAGPKAPKVDEIADAFNESAPKFGLNVELRAEHFFAQVCHESGGFRYVREIWGPTAAQQSYEGRKNLGNTEPGDGKRFMGRGLIQVTGRANAWSFSHWCAARYPGSPDFVAEPREMESYPWALVSAFWFWDTHGLNGLADRDDVLAVTRRINGGTNGLLDRKYRFALAQKAITANTPIALAPLASKDAAGRHTLRRGSKWTADVYVLQKALNMPAPDGKFGPMTEAAVQGFQRSHGLLPDGIAGPGTWAVLDLKLAA